MYIVGYCLQIAVILSHKPDTECCDIAARSNIRVILHPEEVIVLSSERPSVINNSVAISQQFALMLVPFGFLSLAVDFIAPQEI